MIAALMVAAALAWQPAGADYVTLKRAALAGHFPIHYIAKRSSEMPSYDRIAFYPGPADPHWVWENRGEASSPEMMRYRNRALILAAMDFGAAGDQWKKYYDDLTAQDAAQQPPVKDPYRARHAFLDDMGAKLEALAPAIPALTVDPALEANAAKVPDQDLALLVKGFFSAPVVPEDADLPVGVLARYAGPRSKNKYLTYVVERSRLIDDYEFYTDRSPLGTEDASLGAYFEAIADSGGAGPELKTSYDGASDKARFGLTLARAFDMQNDRVEKSSRDEIAWVFRTLRMGMTRDRANALLRTRNLKLDEKPRVDVLEFPIHSSIVCSTSIPVAFTFGIDGRLAQIQQQPDYTVCL